eukprot:gene21721-37839_t
MADVAAVLSGDVWSKDASDTTIIKVVVEDAVHIFRERKELTADCKACSADWRAGDYTPPPCKGSGAAVGSIVGIVVDGL